MKLSVPVLAALVASALPLSALAQAGPPPGGPPPEMRAQMQQMHEAARTAAFGALTPAHRAQVQSIVDGVNNGTTTDLRAAAQQIDAILTPQESTAVLDALAKSREQMRDQMRAQWQQAHPDASPRPEREHENGGPNGETRRKPDAGFSLLMTGVSPDRMRAIRQAGGGTWGGPGGGAPGK